MRTKRKQNKPDNTEIDKDTYISTAGGFMPFPPENCTEKKYLIRGIVHVDLSVCFSKCNPMKCQRNREYKKLLYARYKKLL